MRRVRIAGVADAVVVTVEIGRAGDKRTAIADVADPVAVVIALQRIGLVGTIVGRIRDAIAIAIAVAVAVGRLAVVGARAIPRARLRVDHEPDQRVPDHAADYTGSARWRRACLAHAAIRIPAIANSNAAGTAYAGCANAAAP